MINITRSLHFFQNHRVQQIGSVQRLTSSTHPIPSDHSVDLSKNLNPSAHLIQSPKTHFSTAKPSGGVLVKDPSLTSSSTWTVYFLVILTASSTSSLSFPFNYVQFPPVVVVVHVQIFCFNKNWLQRLFYSSGCCHLDKRNFCKWIDW